MIQKCEICEKSFKRARPQHTCSIECRDRRQAKKRKTNTVNCYFCKNEVALNEKVFARKLKNNEKTFCDRECMYKGWQKQRDEDKTTLYIYCGYCSKYLKRAKSQVKNFKNSYCSREHRNLDVERKRIRKNCEACGKEFVITSKKKVRACSHQHGVWLGSPELLSMRLASEKGFDAFIEEVKNNCFISEDSLCWLPKWTEKSYPPMSIPQVKAYQLHRIMLIVSAGEPTDTVNQAHHICANNRCVSPDHLQWLSPYDNLAEMKERSRYIMRIKRLEKALAELDPNHKLLK